MLRETSGSILWPTSGFESNHYAAAGLPAEKQLGELHASSTYLKFGQLLPNCI